ncbi:MAG TPA: hypothetical protein VN706_23840 [Gemmatimonadaceae bacterium]|nr:hypothetical protein [Gemmatimonadaceae bacterium]
MATEVFVPRVGPGAGAERVERVEAPATSKLAYAAVFAAACVMIGVYWDISWHMSIGRDTFWTPAHLLIQTGGLIAGLGSGVVALHTTFRGSEAERAATVSFWGFRAPLGVWICIWGCIAMLASAPFDNWWHNAYGLDVKIISPPHAVLAIGIFAIVTGALLLTLAEQNRAAERDRRRLAWVLSLTAGFFLMNYALFLTEYSERRMMHSGWFYAMCSAAFPFGLAAMGRAIKLRWAATAAAAWFTAIMVVLMWTIELFPATPKLGPIFQHVTHMVTLPFPLLVIAPAICFDLITQRLDGRVPTLALAAILGATFVSVFLAVQWPFASFLMTPAAANRLINPQSFVYWMAPAYAALTRRFDPAAPGAWSFGAYMLLAFCLATASSALGLGRGAWMRRVQR